MKALATRERNGKHEPAYLNPPPRRRGDMAEWKQRFTTPNAGAEHG